jgi:hypothetical protein
MGLLCSSKLESILMVKLQLLWDAIAEGDLPVRVIKCDQLSTAGNLIYVNIVNL